MLLRSPLVCPTCLAAIGGPSSVDEALFAFYAASTARLCGLSSGSP